MSKNNKYNQMAEEILRLIGTEDNISFFTHCVTRLRFVLKDKSLAKVDEIEQLPGVLGCQWQSGQLQIIVGQQVDNIYQVMQSKMKLDFNDESADTSNNSETNEKKSVKGIGGAILDGMSGCLTPIIPMLIVSAMFKTLTAVLGANMLNVLSETSDLFVLFNFVGDVAFYFLPVAVGYTSAKKFGANPILGLMMGAILIHPTLINMVDEGTSFTVFGIPTIVQNYTSSIIPSILSVWVMSYIEKFLNKNVPSVLKSVFAPFLTILIMLPLALCVFGPAGYFLGEYLSNFFIWMGNSGGLMKILAIAIVAATWQFLVMTGMHWLLIATSMVVMAETGQESFVLAASCSAFSVGGMCLAALLKQKETENKSLSFSYIVAQIVGGVTEPGLYGVGLKYGKPLIGMIAGGFAGGLYAGIASLTAYQIIPVGNFLSLLDFVGGSNMNFINGILSAVIAFVVAAVVTYIIGIEPAVKTGKKS